MKVDGAGWKKETEELEVDFRVQYLLGGLSLESGIWISRKKLSRSHVSISVWSVHAPQLFRRDPQ